MKIKAIVKMQLHLQQRTINVPCLNKRELESAAAHNFQINAEKLRLKYLQQT